MESIQGAYEIMNEQLTKPTTSNEFENDAFRSINLASQVPTYDSVKNTFTFVQTYIDSITWVKYWKDVEGRIYPKLREIELVLYGDKDDPESCNLRAKYGVTITQEGHEKILHNAQNILREMRGVMVLTKRLSVEEERVKEPWWL
jgi:hypothetical protein